MGFEMFVRCIIGMNSGQRLVEGFTVTFKVLPTSCRIDSSDCCSMLKLGLSSRLLDWRRLVRVWEIEGCSFRIRSGWKKRIVKRPGLRCRSLQVPPYYDLGTRLVGGQANPVSN